MSHINIDSKIVSKINNDDVVKAIQALISAELEKELDSVDTDFIDDCIDALLEIQQDKDKSFVPLIPLISSDTFLSLITSNKSTWKRINKYTRAAIVAAIIASTTFTANAAVEAVTGVNIMQNIGTAVQEKLEDLGIISPSDKNRDDELIVITSAPSEEETTTEAVKKQNVVNQVAENSASAATVAPKAAGKARGIDIIDGGDFDETATSKHNIDIIDGDDFDGETTTKPTTTKPGIDIIDGGDFDDTTEPTTKPADTTVTAASPTDKYTEETTKPEIRFVSIRAELRNFKTKYIYGEELSYDGLTLFAVYSDGSEKEIALSDCSYTKALDMNVTADYTLTVSYKGCTVSVDITVRPDEDTRESEICSNEQFDYLLTKDGAFITKYKGTETDINLNTVDDHPVYAVCAGVFRKSDLTSFTSGTVKVIEDNAFRDSENLVNCYIPLAEYIGNNAFENCKKLVDFSFSDKLYFLGEYAYSNTAITSITIPKSIEIISQSLCRECENLKTVEFLGDVTRICDSAFIDCIALESVRGTDSLKEVDSFAFYNDTLVDFDSSLTDLEAAGDYAFAYCNNLDFGILSDKLNSIGAWSFAYCHKVTEVHIKNGITRIPDSAFRGAHISELTLPDGLIEIGDYAFMSTEFREVVLPDSLEKVGTQALYSIKLGSVYFGKNITSISKTAFYRSGRLKFYVYTDTYPLNYAIENKINYVILDDE